MGIAGAMLDTSSIDGAIGMTNIQRVLRGGFLVAIVTFASACVVVEPREGYYDRDHHR